MNINKRKRRFKKVRAEREARRISAGNAVLKEASVVSIKSSESLVDEVPNQDNSVNESSNEVPVAICSEDVKESKEEPLLADNESIPNESFTVKQVSLDKAQLDDSVSSDDSFVFSDQTTDKSISNAELWSKFGVNDEIPKELAASKLKLDKLLSIKTEENKSTDSEFSSDDEKKEGNLNDTFIDSNCIFDSSGESDDSPKIDAMEQENQADVDGIESFLTKEERKMLADWNEEQIPENLSTMFTNLLEIIESKGKSFCQDFTVAESFPAIAYTFGRENWNFVKGIYKSFSTHPNPKIRTEMANSLHQIAQILGPKITSDDLLPIFRHFACDKSMDVRLSLLKNLVTFTESMSVNERHLVANELGYFNPAQMDSHWRLKLEIIDQLISLVKLFELSEIENYVLPLAMEFSASKIAIVRANAVELLAEILTRYIVREHVFRKQAHVSLTSPNSMPLTEKLLEKIQTSFAKSESWRRRQSFAMLMFVLLQKSLISRKIFCHFFKNSIMDLAKEAIPNIRQYFCKIVEFLDKDRLGIIDLEFCAVVQEKLLELALEDPDLEIRTMARVILGLVDKHNDEIDLHGRNTESSA